MQNIKTLDSISNVVSDILDKNYQIASDVANPSGILVRSSKCHDLIFNPELRAIARAGAGTNNIPIDRCTENGIVVFNTPGANANAVKELVFAAMLLASRNLVDAVAWCKTLIGNPDISAAVEQGKKAFVGPEIKNKTLGVIGLGAIGVTVANEGYALGMNVCGYDPFISIEHAWGLSRAVERARSLEALIAQSDYISIHIPLTKETKGYFSADFCEHLKENAILCNFSRGEIVDEDAIIAALEEGKLAKYIVDFPTEKMLNAKNVLCIPHLGASTPESEENCAVMAATQLKDFLENGNIKNSVNLPECAMPRSGVMRICIMNKNTPNMIGQFVAHLSELGVNISNMINKSRGDYAYSILDLDEIIGQDTLKKIEEIPGIIRIFSV